MMLCHEFKDLETPWGPIKLEQRAADSFRVTYGLSVKDRLTYNQACMELGMAVMHWLACFNKLDNSESEFIRK